MPQPATSSLSRTALRTEPECSASTRRLRLCKLARSAPHCLQRGSTHSCGVIPPPRSMRRRISSTATRGSLSERASTAAGLPSATRGCARSVPPFDCAHNSFQCELLQLELDRPLGRTPHGDDTVGDVDRANTGYAPVHCPDLVRRCTGTRHPARHPRLLHFKLLPGGESSVEPARLQPGCTI